MEVALDPDFRIAHRPFLDDRNYNADVGKALSRNRDDLGIDLVSTGGSNATPGGLTNPIPFSGVPTALLKTKDGITDDAARTARMIAGTIGNYMVQRGWISAANVPQVKMARQP